jgi:hypothetical protein
MHHEDGELNLLTNYGDNIHAYAQIPLLAEDLVGDEKNSLPGTSLNSDIIKKNELANSETVGEQVIYPKIGY